MKKYIFALLLSFAILPGVSVQAEELDCVDLSYNLKLRSTDLKTDGEVSLLQDFLQDRKFLKTNPTGYFGVSTRNAVTKFQKEYSISERPFGYVGPQTRAKIKELDCGLDTVTVNTVNLSSDTIYIGQNERLSINQFYLDIETSENSVFSIIKSENTKFTTAAMSPNKEWVALSITNGVHDFAFLYNIKNKKIFSIGFQYGGAVSIKRWWQDSSAVVLQYSAPSGNSFERTRVLDSDPIYPRIKTTDTPSISWSFPKKQMGNDWVGFVYVTINGKMYDTGISGIGCGKEIPKSDLQKGQLSGAICFEYAGDGKRISLYKEDNVYEIMVTETQDGVLVGPSKIVKQIDGIDNSVIPAGQNLLSIALTNKGEKIENGFIYNKYEVRPLSSDKYVAKFRIRFTCTSEQSNPLNLYMEGAAPMSLCGGQTVKAPTAYEEMAGSGSWVVVLDKPIVLNIEQKNITPVKIKIDVEALDKNGIVTDFASKTIEYAG